MRRLILIDGNAIMHRAYHALPFFTTSKKEPVGAVFGFLSMLLKIIEDLKPTHVIATFDRPAPTFRKQLYVGYQAQREGMDESLVTQAGYIHDLVKAFNIPIFEVDGYEADDLIGTLATQAVEGKEKAEVIIVTGDRDMLQLVNSHVRVYAPIKGLTETKTFDEDAVVEKYGITSSQFVDMKALMGDSSDNYPGVAGIGPKGASLLLQKYGTLENIYKHLGDLSEKQAKALAEGAESAGMAKQLAKIVTDAPVKLKWDEAVFAIPDKEKVVDFLREFEFKTLTNRFLELMGEKPREFTNAPLTVLKKKQKQSDENQLSLV